MIVRKAKEDTILYIVLPCYNEAEGLLPTSERLLQKRNELIQKGYISDKSRILYVDDGSSDNSWEIISNLHTQHPEIQGVSLAHNRGHQNALLAGLMFAKDRADVTITIDADLQQDIHAMEHFLDKYYYEGCEIVYGVRNSRNTDSAFKKGSAGFYYGFMKLMGCNLYSNAADYRLMSALSIQALSEYSEVNLFLRGLLPEMGFKTGVVHFEVFEREYGKSKYTLSKMMKLAMDGITSFSVKPIRFFLILGVIIFLISVGATIWTVIDFFLGNTVSGYATLNCSLWMLGGIILLALGVIGEYVGRNYEESKKRPRYFLQDILEDDK